MLKLAVLAFILATAAACASTGTTVQVSGSETLSVHANVH
jgi:hypothetical protein